MEAPDTRLHFLKFISDTSRPVGGWWCGSTNQMGLLNMLQWADWGMRGRNYGLFITLKECEKFKLETQRMFQQMPLSFTIQPQGNFARKEFFSGVGRNGSSLQLRWYSGVTFQTNLTCPWDSSRVIHWWIAELDIIGILRRTGSQVTLPTHPQVKWWNYIELFIRSLSSRIIPGKVSLAYQPLLNYPFNLPTLSDSLHLNRSHSPLGALTFDMTSWECSA